MARIWIRLLLPSFFCILDQFLVLTYEANVSDDQFTYILYKCNDELGNFTPGGTYASNRDAVFAKPYSDEEIDYGFHSLSVGQSPDKVNAVGLCRGDVKPEKCRDCLVRSAGLLRDKCFIQKEGIGWYENCMLRYSNRSIFGVMETEPQVVWCSYVNVTNDADRFKQVVDDLLATLKIKAGSGDSRRKLAEGNATVQSSNDTIRAMLQCTPDISEQNCTHCFDYAFSLISGYCNRMTGSRYHGPSCYVRYETFDFFEPIANAPQPVAAPPHPPSGRSNRSRTLIIATVVPVVALVILFIPVCFCLAVRKPREHIESEGETGAEVDNDIKTTELLQFDIETIRFVTDNFSDANKLGEGGFGIVYKGKLFNGQEVAIKRLSKNFGQGETQFKNEVLLTGKLQHRNLVRLLGFCMERRERLLVYEFVPNKSLDYIIFDPIKRANLDWERRYKIIRGIARGLLYLHEDSRLQIIHRDLKTSNILLDEKLNPKISDFGLAKLFVVNQTQGNTSTIVGTYGYMAPEYIKHGEFSVKSDVFSFGVMVLEIVCGQKNSGIRNGENAEDLLSIVWKNWRAGTASNIVDPTLKHGSGNEIMRCIHIGLLCVQEDIADRPTMASVLLMLNSSSYPLPDPSEPAFFKHGKCLLSLPSGEQSSDATRSNDSGSQSIQGSTNKAPITDVYPR